MMDIEEISLSNLSNDCFLRYLHFLSLKCRAAIRANLIPGAVLQGLAVMIVLLYYSNDSFQSAIDSIATVKSSWGLGFSALCAAVAGGIIPSALMAAKLYYSSPEAFPARRVILDSLFYIIFWVYKGIEVDLFYQLQAKMFGSENKASVVAVKVIVDQFIYNPLWAAHSINIPYLWKDSNYNFKLFKVKLFQAQFWLIAFPTLLLSNWSVWIIACSLIYCLPSPLQIPLFSIMLCFWCILLMFLTAGGGEQAAQQQPERVVMLEDLNDLELENLSSDIIINQTKLQQGVEAKVTQQT
jgi:hypothetical protein